MVMDFMISRLRRESALVAALFGIALLTVACQKVPLLAPSGSTITLTALATALPVNGSTDLIAQVIEAGGTPPHSGTFITFTTNLGTVQPSEAETDISGRVIVKYVAGSGSGTATITAISGGVSASGTNAIKIAVGAAAVGTVRVDANPSVIPATGGTSTITATAFDINGNLLAGVPMSFTTDAGAVSPAVANTDANGKAQTTLTTTKASTVTASAGLASSTGTGTTTTTAAQTATVKVNVNVAPAITVGAPSPAAPSVGQSVTFPLTYGADANGSPVQSVTVDFGDGSRPTVFTGKPASVSHTYSAIGSYSMRATVIDALGDTSSASGSVSVGALGGVTVGTPSPASPTIGQAVSFPLTYTDTAGTIQRISVDYGDGTGAFPFSGKPTSVAHTYTIGGTFAVRVTAFDAFGNTSVGGTSVLISARAQPTVSIATTTTNPTAGTDVTFTASITPASGSGTNIASASVDFGDGTSQALGPVSGSNIAIHHVYALGNTYNVTLTATDTNGGVGTGATTVFVQTATPLTVLLAATPTPNGPNTTESFTATVIGLGNSVVVNYHWVFGGANGPADTSSNQQTRSYVAGSGPITVTVTVTTSTGAQATGSTVITP